MFTQYQGMKKEVYILFYGRVVTNMGALIWPMMTLILSNKMGMSASAIASLLLVMGVCQLPFALLGGKIADSFNKKYSIIICDLITVTCYIIASLIPLSMISVALFFIAGSFAAIEHPAYSSLLADLTSADEREKAFSLQYLGANLGLVLAPTLGGLLFEHYLNLAFLLTALATFSSTLLIFFFVKTLKKEQDGEQVDNIYEVESSETRLFPVLRKNPCVMFYILLMGLVMLVYSQFNFLLPLNMEMNYGVLGATYFGLLTSTNAVVVIFGTPILTKLCVTYSDTKKMVIGVSLIVLGLSMYVFIQGILWLSFVSMVFFTIGEVLNTLGTSPYVSKRIPSTHRGRVASFELIFTSGFQSIAQIGVAAFVDRLPVVNVWMIISVVGVCVVLALRMLGRYDAKSYPLLQK